MKSFRFFVVTLGLALLVSCPETQGGSGSTLKVGLVPNKLELSLTLGIAASKNTGSREFSTTVSLENGHLPGNIFADSKDAWATTINTWTLDASQKQQLVANVNKSFDQTQHDIDLALDALPDEMQITPKGGLNASFKFTDLSGTNVQYAAGLYNTSSKDFLLAAVSFANGASQEKVSLLGLAAWTFSGALSKSSADLNQAALGALVVQDLGLVSVGVRIKTSVALTAQ